MATLITHLHFVSDQSRVITYLLGMPPGCGAPCGDMCVHQIDDEQNMADL